MSRHPYGVYVSRGRTSGPSISMGGSHKEPAITQGSYLQGMVS